MKRLAALITFILVLSASPVLATKIIYDYLDFGVNGITYDPDSNLDAVLGYGGNSVNQIEWTTNTADNLQWYQSFTAPADFNFDDVLSTKFHIYLSDDNDSASEYGWFWSEDSSWVFIDSYDIDPGYYDFDVSLSALDGYGVYAAIQNLSSYATYQSDFFVYRSVLEVEYMPVPEPSTFILLGIGVLGLISIRYKNSK